MQKYLWGGAALIVAAAAGVYVASDYFLRHPESVIARAGNALGTAAVYSNPLSVMNRATTGTDAVRQDEEEVAQWTVVKPMLEGQGESEDTIEPIQVEAVVSGATDGAPAGAAEECEWQPCPDRMPSDPPKPMPYAEVDPSEVSLTCPIDRLIEALANGAAELGLLDDDLIQPGCDPEAIEVLPEEEAVDDDVVEPPMPETAEPNYYHHNYEGCTRSSGGCPYPHYMLPQSPVEIPPAITKPIKIKKVLKSLDKWSWDGQVNRTSERRSFSPPLVDTMEFRPSDAGIYPLSKTGPF